MCEVKNLAEPQKRIQRKPDWETYKPKPWLGPRAASRVPNFIFAKVLKYFLQDKSRAPNLNKATTSLTKYYHPYLPDT